MVEKRIAIGAILSLVIIWKNYAMANGDAEFVTLTGKEKTKEPNIMLHILRLRYFQRFVNLLFDKIKTLAPQFELPAAEQVFNLASETAIDGDTRQKEENQKRDDEEAAQKNQLTLF